MSSFTHRPSGQSDPNGTEKTGRYQDDPKTSNTLVGDDASTIVTNILTPSTSRAPSPAPSSEARTPMASFFLKSFRPESPPSPGNIYMIHLPHHAILTLYDGSPYLTTHPSIAEYSSRSFMGSVYWACEERNGWLAFRNVASGRYLGLNEDGSLACKATVPGQKESFCARHREDRAGYELLSICNEELRRVASRDPPDVLIELTWNFFKVGKDRDVGCRKEQDRTLPEEFRKFFIGGCIVLFILAIFVALMFRERVDRRHCYCYS